MSKRISFSTIEIPNWVELLQWRAEQQPEKRIYSFLADGEIEKEHYTHAQLDLYARSIGSLLQERTVSGERALLIYPSGLEFVAAFFGCLYSGIIAVPVYPPSATRSDRTLTKFRVIAQNVQPTIILTTTALSGRVQGLLAQSPELQAIPVVATDTLSTENARQWVKPDITGDTLAFLQYTSGSTGTPKGVMVTHRNLLENSRLVEGYCQHPDDAHGVIWLPLYHDLGLIGGVLQPLYAGYESTIMPPAAFLQRPIRWLQAASKYHATISGGPNFAYDLCTRKITEEQKATLDLSHWEIVANGAEPVRADTMERFADAFASTGFRRNYFYPCYGLAEYTLVMSAGRKGVYPLVHTFSGQALEHNEVRVAKEEETNSRTLVSIGAGLPGQRILIVDPETLTEVPVGRIGEIWAAGPSVAQGYWQRPEESEQIFRANLANGEGPFLRTGDLGFLYEGELFITGRLKDLIIIRGRNHYPQDIELTAEKSHPAIRSSGSAVFALEAEGEERLIVVAEIERQYLKKDPQEIFTALRQAIAEEHELQVYSIVLLKTGTLPKTSSGKVQRRGTRDGLLNDELDIVARWVLEVAPEEIPANEVEPAQEVESVTAPTKSVAEVRAWLIQQIAAQLKVRPEAVDTRAPFAQYGMDSLTAVTLSTDLEDWLERELPPTLVYDYPNIETLARYLANEKSPNEIYSLSEASMPTDEPIAVIGLGCRFPGADGPDAFWQLLRDGVDGISEVPSSRWSLDEYYAPERTPGKMNTRWGGFLQDVDKFDPYFFGISPREAAGMDPQQRILLEVAWEALENAGIPAERLAGKSAGVFVGVSSNDYSYLQYGDTSRLDAYSGTGNANSIVANRLSYLLDLRGPSMAIDTACSSSLVAVHLACQNIRNGECEVALAAGVNLILTPDLTITFSQAHMMSEYGRCRTFDNAADGYVRGEGCGVVVLKPLSAAQRDGDTVLALIRGSAVNQDGRSNGLTAPNGPSQEAVIRQALRKAGVLPHQIDYVETHGSSTPLGDPIEVDALKAVLMEQREGDQSCVLGSVKTNIGHLEAAAGIAGLIKTVLSLQHSEIPPHLHFQQLNEHISFEDTTFVIPRERMPWPEGKRHLAGVSAFGFGGTNVHVVLEGGSEVPVSEHTVERETHILALSARSEQGVKELARRYVRYLDSTPTALLADICYTAGTGRTHFAYRQALISSSLEELRTQLNALSAGEVVADSASGRVPQGERARIAFLFTGQGSQYIGMARQLFETQPVFREAMERCEQILSRYLSQPLLSVIYPGEGTSSPLDETAFTQPALFALEYALAELWRSWGVEPDIVLGHSVGEYVAACVAGALSLEDGLKLIATRGRLMQELPERGEMIVVFASPEEVERYLEPYREQVAIAAVNGPANTVLSGRAEAIQSIVGRMKADGLNTHPMVVSHAFHSPLMEPMLDAFEHVASEIQVKPLRLPLVSNVTGVLMPVGEMLDASYWREHVRSGVRFYEGMQTLVAQGYTLFLELGPNPVLTNMGKRCLPEVAATWLTSLRKAQDDQRMLAQSVAVLYTQGVNIDWKAFSGESSSSRVALPTYPFERERYWLDAPALPIAAPQPLVALDEGHPLLRSHTELVYPTGMHIWEIILDKHRLPFLSGHRIQGAMAVPVSLYIEMVQAAAIEAYGIGEHALAEIELRKLLIVPEQGEQKVQVILATGMEGETTFHIYSHATGHPEQPRSDWSLHATGKIQFEAERVVAVNR
ncbi:type I polyketide synthase [Ktedonospora formicarum]|uniref:Malonyl CoA-acyl carrier protein transacylase n=1 Tax=Ktedonospora formicarum TaxID=2778364 RepID=A0A8J3MSV1_9CHLR|nr:type I polyketide synthase [Ktedonospora formicarum]GHO44998.1 hypothetical protein KSX_31610 [Ktedonospora formicarum]